MAELAATQTKSRLTTFLFTDIEGSTRLLEALGDAYTELLAEHWRLLRTAFGACGGDEFGAEGDAMFFAFTSAEAAIAAAVAGQRAVLEHPWDAPSPLRVRMGVHTGEARQALGTWVGLAVHQTARTCSAGHGGQVLVSQEAVTQLDARELADEVSLENLGEFRLRDITAVQRIFQLRHPDLPSSFPPLRTPSADVTNLPNQLTTFVGRQQEIADVRRLLRDNRLVTIAGPGGAGKTRLALEVAGAAGPDHPDGVWLVELSLVDDADAAPRAVLAALGASEEGDRAALATIGEVVAGRNLVLVLDNAEHVVDIAAGIAERVLEDAPDARVIVTTREPLGVAGEVVWRVPPLASTDAARLFLDRAAAARADVDFSVVDPRVVNDLCARLDFAPLAIELAAARVGALSVAQIAARIDDRFRLLATGPRTAEPRQRTLRAAIDWSHDLLDESERTALRRLSVFAGSFALDAAEAVCGAGPVSLDLVDALVRKSLVVAEPHAAGEYRYKLLESVREYAYERLVEAEEGSAARDALLDAALASVARAAAEFNGPEARRALDGLDADLPNIRAALEWALTTRPQQALRLAGLLGQFFGVRGHLREGLSWLERALAVAATPAELDSIRALVAAGTLARLRGDLDAARKWHERQLAIAREMKNETEVARALNAIGTVLLSTEDLAGARPLLEEALAIRRHVGDPRGIALSLNNLGALADVEGDVAAARSYYEEHLAIMRDLGDTRIVGQSMHNLGEMALSAGDFADARELLESALAMLTEVGDTRSIALTTSLLGCLARAVGDLDGALARHATSLPVGAELGDPVVLCSNLEGIAAVCAVRGDAATAARLLGAASTLVAARAERGAADLHSLEDARGQARAALGDAAFDAAYAEGVRLTTQEAVAEAGRLILQAPVGE
jgi:predicted ATPase/class 3 adenylate cyclase